MRVSLYPTQKQNMPAKPALIKQAPVVCEKIFPASFISQPAENNTFIFCKFQYTEGENEKAKSCNGGRTN